MIVPSPSDKWLSADAAIGWIAYRGSPEPENGPWDEWYRAERALVAAAADGRVIVEGTPGTEHAPKPGAYPAPIPSGVFAVPDIGFNILNNTLELRPFRPDEPFLKEMFAFGGPYFHHIRVSAADVRRIWPHDRSVAPAKEPAAMPSAPEPRGGPAPVYSHDALRAWYRLRVGTWPGSHPPPSESDDIAAAVVHFCRDIPRDPFRAIRRELAPEAWKKPGPRRKRA